MSHVAYFPFPRRSDMARRGEVFHGHIWNRPGAHAGYDLNLITLGTGVEASIRRKYSVQSIPSLCQKERRHVQL